MKYIVNEQNTCGQASLTDEQRNLFLEGLGFAPNQTAEQINESVDAGAEVENEEYDAPCLYEWDNSVFALEEEVYEIDGQLFLKAFELDAELQGTLDESHADLFINEVRFEQEEFELGDIYDYGDEIFIKLDEAYAMKEGDKKGDKSKDKPAGHKDFENGKKKVVKEMNAADRLAAFNKNKAGAGDTASAQARARQRTSELKSRMKAQKSDNKADTARAEKDAARDAGM